MVEPRGSASKEGQQDALEGGSRHGGTDPESFTYGKKESRLEICVSGSVIWSAGQECGASADLKAHFIRKLLKLIDTNQNVVNGSKYQAGRRTS